MKLRCVSGAAVAHYLHAPQSSLVFIPSARCLPGVLSQEAGGAGCGQVGTHHPLGEEWAGQGPEGGSWTGLQGVHSQEVEVCEGRLGRGLPDEASRTEAPACSEHSGRPCPFSPWRRLRVCAVNTPGAGTVLVGCSVLKEGGLPISSLF